MSFGKDNKLGPNKYESSKWRLDLNDKLEYTLKELPFGVVVDKTMSSPP